MRIFVCTPHSGIGHLDSWHSMAVEALLRQGHEVVSVSPGSPGLDQALHGMAERWGDTLKLFHGQAPEREPSRLAWLEYYYVHGGWMRPRRGMRPPEIVKRLVLGCVFKTAHWLRQKKFSKRIIAVVTNTSGDASRVSVGDLGATLKKAQSRYGRPDFILLTYMDTLQRTTRSWRKFDSSMAAAWGGISFAPLPAAGARRHGAYSSRGCAGLAFMSAEVVALRQDIFPAKYFQLLPDCAGGQLPPDGGWLADTLLKIAAGRKILLLTGIIDERKNLPVFAKLVAKADSSRVLFAVIGQFWAAGFSRESREAMGTLEIAENVFLHNSYIQDEAELNACIAASDALFAVYKNYPGSSNLLVKAALFDKPALVPTGGLMQKHVENYGIGLAQDAGDSEAMLRNLYLLLDDSLAKENFSRFRADFSKEKWESSLGEFVTACAAKGAE